MDQLFQSRPKPCKTENKDRIYFSEKETPWVYFGFPERWNWLLETYLKKYRKWIDPESPILFPGDPKITAPYEQFLKGSRGGCPSTVVRNLIDETWKLSLSENDFRTIFSSYLVGCDLDVYEGLLTGHINHGRMSKTSRKFYLNLTDHIINKKSRRFYSAFFDELEESIKIIKHAS